MNLESSDINKEEFCALHEKLEERSIKNITNLKNKLEK